MGNTPHIIYYIILLVLLLSSASYLFRKRIGKAFGYLAIWLGIFLVIFFVYSLRLDIQKAAYSILTELLPGYQIIDNTSRKIYVQAKQDGHFRLSVDINGQNINMLLDTGATVIILDKKDAQKIGVYTDQLKFTRAARTANGNIRIAHVLLKEVRIGDALIKNVPAAITNSQMPSSLLGMSFLQRLDSFEIRNNQLVISY